MMKKYIFNWLAVFLSAISITATLRAAEPTATQMLASDNAAFAFDLYGQLKAGDGNLFFSPYSISTCLAMTYTGARGNTAKQIAKTFHFYADPVALSGPFGALQNQLNSAPTSSDLELNSVNGLWAEATHSFQHEFKNIAILRYAARVEPVDFRTQAEPTRVKINDWVSGQTRGKINDLIGPGLLNAATKLVLVNAIYFKGKWMTPFKEALTADAPFTVTADKKVQAKLMHLDAPFSYFETPEFQMVELPYRGALPSPTNRPLSMVVLLPKDAAGIKALEAKLNATNLNTWLESGQRQELSLFLPKFKITEQFGLSKTLAMMGMPEAFTSHADFSGMDGARDLFISEVLHKAYVDVNETGTEAAAATAVVMIGSAMRQPPKIIFRADHPFIFLIRDGESGSILFLGRLNDPTQ